MPAGTRDTAPEVAAPRDRSAKGLHERTPYGAFMDRQTEIALRNYDWLVRHRDLDDVGLEWEVGTLVYGDGGATFEASLLQAGFTPATVGM